MATATRNGASSPTADSAGTATRTLKSAAPAAGAAAAGLAAGVAVGARIGIHRRSRFLRPTLLGMPLGPKPPVVRAARVLRDGAKHANRATRQVATATDEARKTREQLEQLNRRSPIEVLLDGLTHRRGAHRSEN